MQITLRPLNIKEDDEIYQMFQEIPAEEDGFENPAHGLSKEEFATFCQMEVAHSQGKNLPEGYVPSTYYVLFADNQPVGVAKFRHYLNDFLRQYGGHIGYGIRPSARGQKFGNQILAEVLTYARQQGVAKALLTIRDYNIRSRKVCEYNGGKLEKIVPLNGHKECFYWIDLNA